MIISKLFNEYGVGKYISNELVIQGKCFFNGTKVDASNAGNVVQMLKKGQVDALSGFYSFYYLNEHEAICLTDAVRSFPVFYAYLEGDLFISDNAYWIADQINDKIDLGKVDDYKLALFTFGNETLYKHINQLKAGELLIFNGCGLSISSVNRIQYQYNKDSMYQQFINEHMLVLEKVFNNLIHYANGRTLVVPLSGGYDSRLIVLMLKKLQYQKVVTYTYGEQSSQDVALSKQVAQSLKYKWLYVDAKKEEYEASGATIEMMRYFAYAGKAVSVPHLQDWLIVKKMKAESMIPEDSIFVPGHVGDILSGECSDRKSVLYKSKRKNVKKAAAAIVDYLFTEKILTNKEIKYYTKSVSDEMKNYGHVKDTASLYESWWLYERTSKFIVNSVRTYEFFCYEWWLPLADSSYFDFWGKVPLKYRIGQKLYCDTITQLMLCLMENIIPREGEENGWLRSVKKFCSGFISINNRNIIRKKINKNLMEVQYKQGLNPIWHFFIYDFDNFRRFKEKNDSVNYMIAEQYIKNFSLYFCKEKSL